MGSVAEDCLESVDGGVQLALWEEYADEVEEQMRVLLADNALLQAALADVRSSLAHERPSSTSGAGLAIALTTSQLMSMCSARIACSQCIRRQSCIAEMNVSQSFSRRGTKNARLQAPAVPWCASVLRSGARYLVCRAGRRESEPWELSASRPPTGEARVQNGVAPAPAVSGSPAGREFIEKHVKPMSEDLEKKRALFMDDASFISEARSRTSAYRNAVSDVTISAPHTSAGQHLA